ncbi:hypothetical protein KR059_001195, partial [Drosophila kikkawai]
ASQPRLISVLLFPAVAAEADPQHTYDGRNGPHVFGTPGNQVYIRGQNDGAYTVPGVGGQFQHSSSPKEHVYTDEQGNTYVNRKTAGGRPAYPASAGPAPRRPRSPQFHVERPGRTVDYDNGGFVVQRSRRSPQFHVERPGRTVDVGSGGFAVSRQSRSPQFHVERPGRTVDVGSGGFAVSRQSRSPQFHVERPGRTVDYNNGEFVVQRSSRSINDARVQGDNFVARDDQAGVWNDNVSVWKRPDGRTVTVDGSGKVHVSGHGHDQTVS